MQGMALGTKVKFLLITVMKKKTGLILCSVADQNTLNLKVILLYTFCHLNSPIFTCVDLNPYSE